MNINAENMDFKELNEIIKAASGDMIIDNCCGQRYIGSGQNGKAITVNGTPGNALGAYLDGAEITVNGNAQDAVGDTMNDGVITIFGNAGDALGYSMRGGKIFVQGDAGYRTGIHMKQYMDKKPIIVVGGKVGSFLGEYLAGGLIIILGLNSKSEPVGNFTGTGMHGGLIFIRYEGELQNLPPQVNAETASAADLDEIKPVLYEYANKFNLIADEILKVRFHKLSPNAKNPYKQLYTEN